MPSSVISKFPNPADGQQFRTLLSRHIWVPIGFGLLTVIFFIAIIYYLLALSRWVDTTTEVIGSSHRMMQLFVDHETSVRGFVITGSESSLAPFSAAEQELLPLIAEIEDQLEGYPQQRSRLQSIRELYYRWREFSAGVVAARRSDAPAASDLIVHGQGKALMDQIRVITRDFIAETERMKAVRSQRAQGVVIILAAGYFLVSLLFSGLMAYWGRRQLRGLAEDYADVLQRQAQQNEVLQQQAWLREGRSRMADRIIGQLPLPILCQNVLHFFGEYLEMVVGALYVDAGDSGRLTRVAGYGFSREMAERQQSFELTEGLVGQVAAERRALYLDQLMPDYFKVNSGLGDGSPTALAVVPVIDDDDLTAVIELGFIRPLTARDREFLQLVSGNIGAAITAASYRRRLHETLSNIQQLNDELQAQQEELRAANTELEEQSQALEESKERLEAQQAELEHANQILEEQHEAMRIGNAALQRSQQQLEEHAHQLEKASRYKSEFLANMSHELRTPLNSSLILSKLLAENTPGNLTQDQVKYALSIHAAGSDLLALINDVLDISKVEAGKLEIVVDVVPLRSMLEDLVAGFTATAADKRLAFEWRVDEQVPATIHTDRHRLEQILRNLLSNAIKFTADGSVRLRVAPHENERITFSVIDTGIGVSADQHASIFDPFYQVDGSSNRKFGGTGLGLSISRQLASLLGGRIDIDSEPGRGSTFTLNIPQVLAVHDGVHRVRGALEKSGVPEVSHRTAPAARRQPAVEFADDRGRLDAERRMLLVIEDEIAFAQILYDLAHESDYQCLVATTADEGFDLAQQYVPHAVLLDMKLPDHSGMTVLARLKEESRTRHIPVHVISVEDRSETALHMGAVGYLTKPVTPKQLREMLVSIERRVAQKVKHVLIVEDISLHASATETLIADDDIDVCTVGTGAEAARLLRQKVFDCLIVDLELPDMSGEELLRELSAEEGFAFPPVIVHASRDLTREEEEKLLRYSRSIIIKSARSPERLLDEVTLFLHKVESELSSERRSMLRLARSRDRALENRKILVVDDDVRNIFAITSVLESRGATVEIGRNGVDAVARLEAVDDIDLVLMDIMMPEMDGYQAMAAIRQQPRFARLPIIAVTARAMRDDQERCLRAGANDYIAKPVDLDRLVSLVRVWLPKARYL